ncbi:LPXTG cell wall anchor domain-containing protein [Candidatus Saccharibacteria bacterium]|nr:LPXTG cell wall anchor domain-containing protein [Candidatus Saccharibacteria bacterium]
MPAPAPVSIPKTGATASAVLGLGTTAGAFGFLRRSRKNLMKSLLKK